MDGGNVVVEGQDMQLQTKYVVPLGLIVMELVTNAFKHGAKKVTVLLAADPSGKKTLSVTDDGHGLPADFNPAAIHGLGMKVVTSLVSTLNGDLTFGTPDDGGAGARFTILFDVR